MKTSELSGAALDWAVAQIELRANDPETNELMVTVGDDNGWTYRPSTDWAQGGPIIEREAISLCWEGTVWVGSLFDAQADNKYEFNQSGPTPLIAAMRAHVASKLGETVNVPEDMA